MRIKSLILLFAILLMSFPSCAVTAQDGNFPQEATLLLNETYDDEPEGYYVCPKNTPFAFNFPEGKEVEEGVVIIEADCMIGPGNTNGVDVRVSGVGTDAAGQNLKAFHVFTLGRKVVGGENVGVIKATTTNWPETTARHTIGEFNQVRLICDIDNDKYYLQVNGEDVDFSSYDNDRFLFDKITGIAIPLKNSELSIDNINIYTANSLSSFVSSPKNNSSDIVTDEDIEIKFSQKMNISTISKENFVLKNTTKNETVDFEIIEKKDSYIKIKPTELLGDNTYKFSSTTSLRTANDEEFEVDFTEFSTKAEEIIDPCILENPEFLNGIASVTVNNDSINSVTATVIAALYEKLTDGNETFIEHKTQEMVLGGESNETYTFNGFVTEESKEYAVRFFLWDSVSGKTHYAKSVVVNTESLEGNKVYKTNRAEGTITETDVNRAYVSFESDFDSTYPKRLTYVIENPSGVICAMGQTTSDDSGIAECKMRFRKGTPSGTYTIKYKADGIDEASSTFILDMSQAKPTALNVRIEGEKVADETLEGNYEYFHIGNLGQNGSSFSWYICDTEDGDFSAIEGENKKTLLVTDFMTLKYVRFGVTANTGTVAGSEVLSDPVKIYASPKVTDVKISGQVKVGNTVSASYKAYHPEGVEVRVNCRWLLAEGNNYTEISTKKSLTVSQSVGQGIVLEITPVIDVYPYSGKSVRSAAKSVQAASSSVGAPSGGGGGDGVVRPSVQKEETPAPVVNDNFNDVPKDYWAYENIKTLSAKNIIKGKGEGNFAPEETVTRAEFVTMIVRALNLEQSGEVEFSDVNEEDWYYSAINAAASLKIVSGHDGSFRPLEPITREEMAVIISNACSLSETENNTDKEVTFTDASEISSWAKESIAKMVDAKILTGFEDGSFRGKSFSTRAQSAAVICRLLGL